MNKRRLIRRVTANILIAVLAFSFVLPSAVNALTSTDRQRLHTPFYDPTAVSCAAGNVGTVASTLPEAVPEPHRSLFTQASTVFDINPSFLAAIFLSEHDNVWSPFDSQWASSPKGASGPFQFMPGTWDANKIDGNNDGTFDVNNIYDATYAAANKLGKASDTNTPLGSIDIPYAPGTMLYIAAAYNWGGGNVERKTNPDSPLSAGPKETQEYLSNVYNLITSGFTQPGTGYNPPRLPDGNTATAATIVGQLQDVDSCSGGVVAGNIVQTALNLAWETRGHGPNEEDAKPTYRQTMPEYNGSTGSKPYSDCGVFVSTVMRASGADPEYPKRGTSIQLTYLRSHPEKYALFDDITNTSQLVPGDILIFSDQPSGHTYIYVGQQAGNYSSTSASLYDHVPEAAGTYFDLRGNHFTVARLIK